MTVDETEPISQPAVAEPRRRVDPWRILAVVSTAVSVATIATLVWTVNKLADDPTPAERMHAAAGVSTVMAPPVAPAAPPPPPAPAAAPLAPVVPVAQSVPVTQQPRPVQQAQAVAQPFTPMQAPAAPMAAPAANPWPNVTLPPPNVVLPGVMPQLSIDAIIAAVSGTAGWIGGGTLDLIGDVLVASAANNGGGAPRPDQALAALMTPLTRIPPPQLPRELDITRMPPPQLPRELDITRIPPPQWPRELDITKIPPPHVHWDRILPPPPRLW
ncbi:hypothetical protein [Mycolicibacterium sp.]|uniref:hypothetical protein n=1 Tax=Mycolicibacterium sp. TaxID=2320850 RepID=UPI003D0D2076